MSRTMLVRIPLPNEAAGLVIYDRTITTPRWTQKFTAGRWYEVNEEVCRSVLAFERQRAEDPNSPLAFQIMTREEAARTVQMEEMARLGRVEQPDRVVTPTQIPDLVVSDSELNLPRPVHEVQIRGPKSMRAQPVEPTLARERSLARDPQPKQEAAASPDAPDVDMSALAASMGQSGAVEVMEMPDVSDIPGAAPPLMDAQEDAGAVAGEPGTAKPKRGRRRRVE